MAQNGGHRRHTELALPGTTARVHHHQPQQQHNNNHHHLGVQQLHQMANQQSIQAQQQPMLPLPIGSSGGGTSTNTLSSLSRGPPATSPPPLPATSSTSSAGVSPTSSPGATLDRDFITLAQPRPGIARTRNEYIDTPLRPPPAPGLAVVKLVSGNNNGSAVVGVAKSPAATAHLSSVRLPRTNPAGGSITANSSRLVALHPTSFATGTTTTANSRHTHHHHHPHHNQLATTTTANQLPILTQPCVTSSFKSGTLLKKSSSADKCDVDGGCVGVGLSGDASAAGIGGSGPGSDADADSIICQQCGRCKCDACCSPRELPSSWICGKKYQCSADTTLDYCSCMCCVKACFYHCSTKDYDDGAELACADRPCSCMPYRRWARWGCLGALALALPCLLCYWPMRGCLHLCQLGYTRYHSQGCRCVVDRRKSGSGTHTPSTGATSPGSDSGATPTKRLLDSPGSGAPFDC